MRRLLGLGSLFAAVMLTVPSSAQAQTSIWVGGGATIPTSDFKEYAKTGWMAGAGFNVAIGENGLWVGASGSYGSNKHEGTSGDKTNLMSALGEVGYRVGDREKVGVFFFGNVGMMNHQYVPGTGSKESSWKLAYGGGAGVDVPMTDTITLWFAGQYLMRAKEDNETTSFFGLFAGLGFAVGTSGM